MGRSDNPVRHVRPAAVFQSSHFRIRPRRAATSAQAPAACQPLGAARSVRRRGPARALGAGLAGAAAAAEVAGREDRQRAAWARGAHRSRRFQALDAGADAERRGGGRCRWRARPVQRQARVCRCRAAIRLPPGAGDRRHPDRGARRAPDAPGQWPLRHRRHPGPAGRARPARRARRAGTLRALQHRPERWAHRLRRPRGRAPARGARPAPGAAFHQQPAVAAPDQGAAATGLRGQRQRLRLARRGAAVRRLAPHRRRLPPERARSAALPGLHPARPAHQAAGRHGGRGPAPGLRADAPAVAARGRHADGERPEIGGRAGRRCAGLRCAESAAG